VEVRKDRLKLKIGISAKALLLFLALFLLPGACLAKKKTTHEESYRSGLNKTRCTSSPRKSAMTS
jgi:hypothetical protein